MDPSSNLLPKCTCYLLSNANAKLSSEQRDHLPNPLCRKHLSRFKPKMPSVANLLKFIVMAQLSKMAI
ncbi:hypothetical protein ELS82_23650 [Vibrio ouci]|uniref:Uncharacterized protein n=1 Tax=Vibrio ouci TaxID=2499078 RepID=A0A4Y8W8D4_9VIBR|nr:hypothetical protein ELS82_23650 [Vibrio ouci]